MQLNRKCPVCGNEIVGRSDKRYCSLKCKSANQYEKRQKEEAFFLRVERHLRTNRKVLKHYNKSGYTTIRKSELEKQGFDSRYHNHYWENQKGDRYSFVFEYGFLEKTINGKEKLVLVTWQDYMKLITK